jgi:outer membrane protein TolC
MKTVSALLVLLCAAPAIAAESDYPDLPPHSQVDDAINNHINVLTAETGIKIEQGNQRKWQSGNYEFNVRAGTGQRKIGLPDQTVNEWDIAIERPLRLPNKMLIDDNIGDEVVNRAEQALGDAHHETGRTLLHLWFNWQREQAQATQWQQQVDILRQQAATTEKRFKAGDAPKMEWNQAQAAVSQASVALQQAKLRTQLAGADLTRQFPAILLPPKQTLPTPILVEHDFSYWKDQILDHNHEIELAQSEKRIQQMLAERGRADRIPDPTVGLRYSNEMGGNEKVTGLYLSIPISFGLRNTNAQHAEYLAEIASNREAATRRRLEGDVYAAHAQAVSSYQTWQQAQEAGDSLRKNAELVTRAYTLGESSLSETLTARRLALESTLTENIAQLDANETRYRLLLDAHQLWAMAGHDDHAAAHH